MTSKYLVMFLVLAISLELLDLIFRGYTAVKSWDILRGGHLRKGFHQDLHPAVRPGQPGAVPAAPAPRPYRPPGGTWPQCSCCLGVFMMRWNVVIGGQAFSAIFRRFHGIHPADHPARCRNLQGRPVWSIECHHYAVRDFLLHHQGYAGVRSEGRFTLRKHFRFNSVGKGTTAYQLLVPLFLCNLDFVSAIC